MAMNKIFIVLIISVLSIFAQNSGPNRFNQILVSQDTIWIKDTDPKWSNIFWQGEWSYKSVMFSFRDTGIAGFANDSCKYKIELYQVFPDVNKIQLIRCATDDSILYDSLKMSNADTGDCYNRGSITLKNSTGEGFKTVLTDTVKTAATQTHGRVYKMLSPDYSPAIAFKITGVAGNRKRSVGSQLIISLFAQQGESVYPIK
jgi:hypothetical protein